MSTSNEGIFFYVQTEVKNGSTATRIFERLTQAHGNENICSLRQIQRLCKDIKNGERITFKRRKGSGRPRSSRTDENIEAVRQLREEDPLLTVAHISCILHMHESSVQRILTEDLKKRSYCAKWIPYSLTDLHKQQRWLVHSKF